MLHHPSKYSLEEIEKDIWESLKRGTQIPKDDFHRGVVATLGLDNSIQQRTVILRKVIPSEQTLLFHTDNRSQKVQEIQQNHQVSFLLYHHKQQVQLRFEGQAVLHQEDDLVDKVWKESSIGSRKVYLSKYQPAQMLSQWGDGLPEGIKDKKLTIEETEIGQANFAVIRIKARKLDWLSLHPEGHARAIFEWLPDVKSYWVSP